MYKTKEARRKVAAGAARAQLRRLEVDLYDADVGAAMAVLDDLARENRQLVASYWWIHDASRNQLDLFKREWNAWHAAEIQRIEFESVPSGLW